jgi:hypothetical protein
MTTSRLAGWGMLLALALGAVGADAGHRVGGGANYWKTLDDIELTNIDEEGFGYFVGYQYLSQSLWGLGLELEQLPDGWGGSEDDVYAPQAYLMLGRTLYVAGGAGYYYTDGEFADQPFYNLRAGVDLPLAPAVSLDVFANYRLDDWDDLGESDTNVDTDTVILGVALRFGG